jgi:hypothetical protein
MEDFDIRVRHERTSDLDVITLPFAQVEVNLTHEGVDLAMDRKMMVTLHYYLNLWLEATGAKEDIDAEDA